MPSRRRSRSKNLTNNLADVQRRLRFLERRPVRTKLANRVVTRAAIAPNSVSADEAEFGASVVVPPGEDIDDFKSTIENPKEGLLVVDATTGESQIYSEVQETYYDVSDPTAQASADAAADAAAVANTNAGLANTAAVGAQFTASSALTTAGNKNRVFYATSEADINTQAAASSYTLKEGDLWFDTANDYRMSRRGATSWGAFQLGDLAVSAISAGKINAGEITLSKGINIVASLGANANSSLSITNNGIAAVNESGIETFSINSNGNAFFGGSLTAGISISAPIISLQTNNSGFGLFRTDTSGRRIEITNQDDIVFYSSLSRTGTITGISSIWQNIDDGVGTEYNAGVMIYGGALEVNQGAETYPSIVATATQVQLSGSQTSRIAVNNTNVNVSGPVFQVSSDIAALNVGYSANGAQWSINFGGPVASDYTSGTWRGEMLLQGTGQPPAGAPSNGFIDGQIVFRYT